MNCREVFLSPNFHICDNHIPATLHRTNNLLKLRTKLVLNDCFHQNHHHIDFISICYRLFHAAILLQVMSVVQLQAIYPDCLFSHMSLKELEELEE